MLSNFRPNILSKSFFFKKQQTVSVVATALPALFESLLKAPSPKD